MLRGVIAFLLLALQPGAGRLQPVVGLWSPAADGDGAIVANGSAWSGRTARETLVPVATALFGGVSQTFLDNGSAVNAFPIAIDRATRNFSDGTLLVQFRLISGPTDQSAGLVLGMQSSGAYHFVRYNTKDGNLALWSFADGERRVITKGDGMKQLPLGVWHELVVRVDGVRVSASVTGHPELDARFTLSAALAGRVGVWAKRDVVTAFRGFSVSAATP